jgi:hypothetical protein
MPHKYYHPCYDDINIWWRVTVMKLTTESSASLYSYLPLTSNILLTTLLSQPLNNLCPSLDTRHQITCPHKLKGKMSVWEMRTCNMLNWMVASIAWTYPALISKIIVLKICQDLTCLKPDLWQSKGYISQAMWHKIQTARDFTRSTAQNPFSTVQLLHEYRLPEKPQILTIC